MSYQVLARKWRPRTFREMVGQEHVLQALINALDHNRLHHAYLFTGTRGVGKTTIARILAKCLNCETGVSSQPCGTCGACTEIGEGRFVDLIEVDAASRTKVEDTRELLENVQYAPTRGRYKVYLIDEVHMLSSHSFNALLKTLEEPPPHIKFLLATTDPQKLPVTILSRCLQFNLKNMAPERIVQHLQYVLEQEMVPFEESALWQLGRAADGSMRDALSLADQAIAFGGGKVAESEVRTMLGTIDQALVYDILEALAELDGKRILATVARLSEHAPDYSAALAELLTILHRVAIAQALPEAVDNSFGDRHQVLDLAQRVAAEDIQLFYQTALLGRRDLPLAPDPRGGFEMVLLRMLAFKPQGVADIPSRPLPGAATGGQDAQPRSQESRTVLQKPQPPVQESQSEPKASNPQLQASDPQLQASDPQLQVPDPQLQASDPQLQVPDPQLQASDPQLQASDPQLQVPDPQLQVPDPQLQVSESQFLETEPQLQASETQLQELKPRPTAATQLHVAAGAPEAAERPQTAIKGAEPATLSQPDSGEQKSGNGGVTAMSARPVALEQSGPESWLDIYRGLRLGGILQSTVANCLLVGRQGRELHFILDENNSTLYDDSHQQRMADILSDYFGEPVQVRIQLGQVSGETPSAWVARLKRERQAQALNAMRKDANVQELIGCFEATLREDTVEPVVESLVEYRDSP